MLVSKACSRRKRTDVETWRTSWFEEGSRLLYIVRERDRAMLPVQIEPHSKNRPCLRRKNRTDHTPPPRVKQPSRT